MSYKKFKKYEKKINNIIGGGNYGDYIVDINDIQIIDSLNLNYNDKNNLFQVLKKIDDEYEIKLNELIKFIIDNLSKNHQKIQEIRIDFYKFSKVNIDNFLETIKDNNARDILEEILLKRDHHNYSFINRTIKIDYKNTVILLNNSVIDIDVDIFNMDNRIKYIEDMTNDIISYNRDFFIIDEYLEVPIILNVIDDRDDDGENGGKLYMFLYLVVIINFYKKIIEILHNKLIKNEKLHKEHMAMLERTVHVTNLIKKYKFIKTSIEDKLLKFSRGNLNIGKKHMDIKNYQNKILFLRNNMIMWQTNFHNEKRKLLEQKHQKTQLEQEREEQLEYKRQKEEKRQEEKRQEELLEELQEHNNHIDYSSPQVLMR
jgi:hypothetical protein